jgi:ATP phosphoribosyltransferase regulatory subunit
VTSPDHIEAPLPKGVADFLPETADKIGYIDGKIRRVFELWGFRRIITPLLEYHDVLALAMGEELREKAFRFDDRQSGRLLAIPPDITPQVARIVATRLKGYPLPHRLYYSGKVLRHVERQSGRSREIFQAGVELIGLDSPEADAEMVAMAVEVLLGLGVTDFKIDLGQNEFFRGLMADAGVSPATRRQLQGAISRKEYAAVNLILEKEPITDSFKEEIVALPRLFGGPEVVAAASRIVTSPRSLKALENIGQVLEILNIHGVTDYLTIDLGEIRGLNYHTGLTFEGFVTGLGESVCSGGRYDNLTANYGFPAPATGFAFNILSLLAALDKRPEIEATKTRDFLLFNLREDRREVLEIAQCLRQKGYTTARDIIRRDFDSSLEYARKTNIQHMLVIGGSYCGEDEVHLVRVADNRSINIRKNLLFETDELLNFDSLQGDGNG